MRTSAAASRALACKDDESRGRSALVCAVLAGPLAAVASALAYVVVGVCGGGFDGMGPTLPAVLASVFTGLATTMLGGAVIVMSARGVGGGRTDPRGELAIGLVPWTGTAGTAVGAMLPVAVWLATHP